MHFIKLSDDITLLLAYQSFCPFETQRNVNRTAVDDILREKIGAWVYKTFFMLNLANEDEFHNLSIWRSDNLEAWFIEPSYRFSILF